MAEKYEEGDRPPDQRDAVDLETLVSELQPSLLRLAWSILRDWSLASDAVQEALSLLGQKWGEIKAEHRTGWIVKTVQLQAMSMRRSRGRLEKRQVEWSAVPEPQFNGLGASEDQLLKKERIERLREEIEKLPLTQRQVVQRRLHGERSFSEIAKELELPLGTVLSRMRLATQKLRLALRDEQDEDEPSGDK